MARPYRSVLYIPAANARAMDKARDLPADAIIFDLEDAVSPDQKSAARDGLGQALAQDYGPRARILRINALATEWGRDDALACAGALAGLVDAVLIPKVDGPTDLDRVADADPRHAALGDDGDAPGHAERRRHRGASAAAGQW